MTRLSSASTHYEDFERSAAETQQVHGLSLRGNAVWSLLGEGAFAAGQLGMLVVMARLGTDRLVGTYALGLALTSPVFLFFALQLRTLLAADVEKKASLRDYATVRLLTTVTATLVSFAIAVLFMPAGGLTVAWAIAASKAIDSLHDLTYGIFWRCDRMDFIAKSMLLRAATGWTSFALVFWLTGSLSLAVVSLCGAWFVVLCLHDVSVAGHLTPAGAVWWLPQWSADAVRRIFWLGFPAGVLSCLVSLQVNVPRFFVQQEVGEAGLGIFSAIASIFIGLELIARSFNHAAMPRLAGYFALRDAEALGHLVKQLTIFGLIISAALVAGSVILGRPVIHLLFGATYAAHSTVFIILTFGFAIRISTMPTAMTLRAVNAYWSLVTSHLLAIVVLFIACLCLVPRYGLVGCALACVFGFAIDGFGRIALHLLFVVRANSSKGLVVEALQAA